MRSMERFEVLGEYRAYIDEHTVDALEAWFSHGGDLSGFLYYLLGGDYESAACNADLTNLAQFGYLVKLLAQSAPDDGFGSREKVNAYVGLLKRDGAMRLEDSVGNPMVLVRCVTSKEYPPSAPSPRCPRRASFPFENHAS